MLTKSNSFLGKLLSILVAATMTLAHECQHDHHFKDHQPKVLKESFSMYKSRVLQQATWHPLRIILNYDDVNEFVKTNSGFSIQIGISTRNLVKVQHYFETLLQVHSTDQLNFGGISCNGNQLAAFNGKADLVIYVHPETQNKGYFAAAVSCFQSPVDSRSVIGLYLLNFFNMKISPINEYLYYSTFAHEFTHILGFSISLFPLYVDENRTTLGVSRVWETMTFGDSSFPTFKLPELVKVARDYYGCQALPGIPLQYNRTVGPNVAMSHWDRKFNPSEFMNPLVENPGHISILTLALLKSTGWYNVNYTMAQNFKMGANRGCGHFNDNCPFGRGFCPEQGEGDNTCTYDYTAKAACTSKPDYSDTCKFKQPLELSCLMNYTAFNITADSLQADETYGRSSRCILISMAGSNFINNKCYLTSCSPDGRSMSITLNSPNITFNCSSDFQSFQVNDTNGTALYSVICPQISDFCGLYNIQGPNNCNDQGISMSNGQCFCFSNLTGDDCSQTLTQDQINQQYQEIWGSKVSSILAFYFTIVSLNLILIL